MLNVVKMCHQDCGLDRMRQLSGITDSVDMNLSKPQKIVEDRESWYAAVHGVAQSDIRE